MAISVCMATYNGERFIRPQLRSILDQLSPDDEVVIVDDCSTDGTVAAITEFKDSRIRLYPNQRNRREVYSFGVAIAMARKPYIFLADQDDVWLPGRVDQMLRALESAAMVTTNFTWIDADGRAIEVPFDGVRAKDSARHAKNIADIFIGRTNYFGCAMAFRRELARLITPMPAYVESHDLLIALAGNLIRSNIHLDSPSLLKRRHGNNATGTVSNRTLSAKLRSRLIFARSLWLLRCRRAGRQPTLEQVQA